MHEEFDYNWRQWLSQIYNEVINVSEGDFALRVARGQVTGVSLINKFGRVIDNVDNGVITDIWDGSSAGIANLIWDAPTTARVHAIVSSSTNDTDGGTGAYSVKIYGLTSWSAEEVSETVTLNGMSSVNTTNSYVIIHRMVAMFGANTTTGANKGQISATAATDATVTSYILAGRGQSEMAIYGVPSSQTLYITDVWGAVSRGSAGAANLNLLVNANPDVQLLSYNRKGSWAAHSTGATTAWQDYHSTPRKFAGPCIVKIHASGSANNMDVSAGFNGYLVNN
jgi:hypothetical protein